MRGAIPVSFSLSCFVDLRRGSRQYKELDDGAHRQCHARRAAETAYKAVMKPKEGTILTVARGARQTRHAELAESADDLEMFFRASHRVWRMRCCARTPDMLPVLKEAGVVDSGGQGLMQALKGAYDGFLGKEVSLHQVEAPATGTAASAAGAAMDDVEIKYGYCTEFIINAGKPLR